MSEIPAEAPERIGPEREALPAGEELSTLGKAFVAYIECILTSEAAIAVLEEDKAKSKLGATERTRLRHTWREETNKEPGLFQEVVDLATADTHPGDK